MPSEPRQAYALDDLLSAEERDALRHLELFARRAVEGVLHGGHRSRRKGVSTDFDHHKVYQPGDSLKHIDWKVSARHDDYFVKRYIEDTALSVRLVVDRSASMLQESGGPSKYLQAARLAAGLAYLVLRQRDSVGLVLTAADEQFWLPIRSAERHLVQILRALASRAPAAPDGLAACLKTILDRAERRGLVVAISDFMFEPTPVRQELARLQAQGHEVLLFQLRDPNEEDFPFNRWVHFQDRERPGVRYRLDAVPLKRIYQEEYRALVDEWEAWCRRQNIHWVAMRSDQHVEVLLAEYLFVRTEVVGKA